jgi:hypothetical protein
MNNISDENKIAIFGYPRAGTKLIASILQSFGYFNYGEYFDTWTSEVIDGVTRRASAHVQNFNHKELAELPGVSSYKHSVRSLNRLQAWRPTEQKWSVTLWNENFAACPPLFSLLTECRWICPTRDPWEQYLSRLIVYYNQNPDGEIDSDMVVVTEADARRHYWNMHKVLAMQNYLIDYHHAVEIKFDELISGTFAGFGQPYMINTVDQHVSLSKYITNFDKVRRWYTALESLRADTDKDAIK